MLRCTIGCLFLSLLTFASCSKGEKETTGTPAEPAVKKVEAPNDPKQICAHIVAVGMQEADSDCDKLIADMKRVFASRYDEGVSCIMAAQDRQTMGACMMEFADPERLAAEMEEFRTKSKTAETASTLTMLHSGVAMFIEFGDPAQTQTTIEALQSGDLSKLPSDEAKKTLPPAVGPTPGKGACCEAEDGRCEPNPELWEHPSWKLLSFEMNGEHFYSYEYAPGADGKSFVVSAYGDLDCDGTFSTFRLAGSIGADGKVAERGEVTKQNELE